MESHHITWFMREISMHAYGAEVDIGHMAELTTKHDTIQSRLVWFHLASFLSHVGMISKFLAPVSKQVAERGGQLKELLGVDSSSEVLPRNARDNTEHFDERVDNWVSANSSEIMEVVLPNRRGYDILRGDQKRVCRVLLLEEQVFISENRDGSKFELELNPLASEVARIGVTADAWIQANSPYVFVYPRQK